MKKSILIASLLQIASANKEGFTVDAKTLQPINEGFAVACKETQNSFNAAGLESVVDYVIKNNIQAFGGWYNSENGRFYFDATTIVNDRAKAIELGRINEQIAIFNLSELEEIAL